MYLLLTICTKWIEEDTWSDGRCSWYVVQCRAVSDAHICASYLSYLHHSTVVTVGLPPKQDRQPFPSPASVSMLSARHDQSATLSEHFFYTLPKCNPALLAISHSACHASECRMRAERCIPIVQHTAPGHTLGSWQFLFSVLFFSGSCNVSLLTRLCRQENRHPELKHVAVFYTKQISTVPEKYAKTNCNTAPVFPLEKG